MGLPPDLVITPVDLDDLDELVGLIERVCLAESGRKRYTRDELKTSFEMPGFDVDRDTILLRDRAGAPVGAAWMQSSSPFVSFNAVGFVAPERNGEGIGTGLLEWARGLAESRMGEAPEGTRVTLGAWVDAAHGPSIDLMSGFGMELARYLLEMRVDLTRPTPEPEFPEGIEVRSFRPGHDDVPAYKAIDDAFRDHFGHVERPLEDGLARFRHRMSSSDVDPSLWWVAVEGEEIVGANLCLPSKEGDERIGYVGTLSVRKPWRGRGLAKAMLYLAFREFQRRGKTVAALRVDAENMSGAIRLYETVGMRETKRLSLFEIQLRAGRDLVVR